MLDEKLSAWDLWMGSPHESVTGLPEGTAKSANGRGSPTMGLGHDPKGVFSVEMESGEPGLRITGEIWGGLTTPESFSDYHLRLDVKWGKMKWEPRLMFPRKSGVLHHCTGPDGAFWNTWKRSLEFEVQENDMDDLCPLGGACGDVRFGRGALPWTYNPTAAWARGAGVMAHGWNRAAHLAGNFEEPNGDGNTPELYTLARTAVHVVNGRIVNVVRNTALLEGTPLALVRLEGGQLQLRSESAEVFYRRIQLRPITEFPAQILRAVE